MTRRSYRTWHAAYCRWHDHREAGHHVRAFLWGELADMTLRVRWTW